MGGAGDGDDFGDDPDRDAILARRRKLIAVALAGMTSACGSSTCLRPLIDSGAHADAAARDSGMGMDAAAGDSGMDAGPAVCLDIAIDAGGIDDGGVDSDAEPMPCLTPMARMEDDSDDGEPA